MNKMILTLGVSLISLAAVSPVLAGSPVKSHDFRFECPNASGGVASERLTNSGTSISGMGEENIDGVKSALIIFGGKPTAGVPADLSTGSYTHSNVSYNPHTGRVVCYFTSSKGSDPFHVSYTVSNIKRGYVVKTDSARTITIRAFQG